MTVLHDDASSIPLHRAHPTVVVLPFSMLNGDNDAAYVAEGMSDEIVLALRQLRGVRVIAQGSAAAFRGTEACAAGLALGADAAVEGWVQREGSRRTLSVRIWNVATRHVMWEAGVDADFPGLFVSLAGIARRVAELHGIAPDKEWMERVARPVTNEPEAYDLLLLGRFHAEKRPIGVKLAMQCFDRAIRLDGNLAPAFGALGLLWANFGIFLALPPNAARDRSREYARCALEIDALEPQALATVMSNAAFYDWNFAVVDEVGARLLAAAPSFPTPYQVLLYAHAARGNQAMVHALGREVQLLDPYSVDPVNDYGYALHLVGDHGSAVAILETHLQAHPEASEVHRRLGLALVSLGRHGESVAHLEHSVAISRRHAWGVANLACALALAGNEARARELLAELAERAEGELVPLMGVACVHTALGDPDAAFEALDRALDARDYWLLAIDVEPLLAPLRTDARFSTFRARCAVNAAT